MRRKLSFRGHQAYFPRFTVHIAHTKRWVTEHAPYSLAPPHFSIGKAVYMRDWSEIENREEFTPQLDTNHLSDSCGSFIQCVHERHGKLAVALQCPQIGNCHAIVLHAALLKSLAARNHFVRQVQRFLAIPLTASHLRAGRALRPHAQSRASRRNPPCVVGNRSPATSPRHGQNPA